MKDNYDIAHDLTMEYMRRSSELKKDLTVPYLVKYYFQVQVEILAELDEYIPNQQPNNPQS